MDPTPTSSQPVHATRSPRSHHYRIVPLGTYFCLLGLLAWSIVIPSLYGPLRVPLSMGTVQVGERVPNIGSTTPHWVDRIDHFVQPKRELPGNKVFMVGPWVPTRLVEHNSWQDPNLEYHVFNYSSMAWSVKLIDRELREKAGLEGAWEAWASMRAWAYRADLWRYMVLWSQGGMYIDSKVRFMLPMSTWAALSEDEEFSCCRDHDLMFRSTKFPGDEPVRVLSNGILSARKGSHVMLEAIRTTVENVLNRTYVLPYFDPEDLGWLGQMLCISGPVLLGYAAKDDIHTSSMRVPCRFEYSNGYLELNDMHLFENDQEEHQSVKGSGNDYGTLYFAKKVYCESEPPDPTVPDIPCDVDALLNAIEIQGT